MRMVRLAALAVASALAMSAMHATPWNISPQLLAATSGGLVRRSSPNPSRGIRVHQRAAAKRRARIREKRRQR